MKPRPDKGKIKILKNGPYLVTGDIPLAEEIIVIGAEGEPERWAKGRDYPRTDPYTLCRCGASKKPPFCDGSHLHSGFDGTETAAPGYELDEADRTTGPELDLTWSAKLCAGARFCHRAGDAWNATEHSEDPARREIAVQEACDCPTGSLIAWDKKTGKAIEPEMEPSIGLIVNPKAGESGPLWVKGGIPIESADGTLYETRNRVTLCRCGASKNKPFCDGSHTNK
ncbi:MAG: CDGSH iron-sulfur domain-containing protein [Acidobacteriota bacterium]|nr:CDGSH iron-sulfur domain-containing protein [Acidobacteriota bacterium]